MRNMRQQCNRRFISLQYLMRNPKYDMRNMRPQYNMRNMRP